MVDSASSKPPFSTNIRCSSCDVTLAGPRAACTHCEAQANSVPDLPTRFSLSTLMLLMTLASICLGVTAIAPGVGIALIVLAVPAAIRTWDMVGRRLHRGVAAPTADKIRLFLLSLGLATIIGLAGSIAFFAVCTGSILGLNVLADLWAKAPWNLLLSCFCWELT